jgi:hypothetical protein
VPRAEAGAVPDPDADDLLPDEEEAPDPTCCLSVALAGAVVDPDDEDDMFPFFAPLLEEAPEPKFPPELPEDCPLGVCASAGGMTPAAKVAIIATDIPYALKLITRCSTGDGQRDLIERGVSYL